MIIVIMALLGPGSHLVLFLLLEILFIKKDVFYLGKL